MNLLDKSVIISVEVVVMKHFELSDDMWRRIETVLKKDKATWRGKSAEKRLFIEGVLSLLQNKKTFSTCLNWNNLDPKYGEKYSQCRKFNRWRNNGTWEKLLPLFAERHNYCWIAELGTYEVLVRNRKMLIKTNRVTKDNYDIEKENLNEDIGNLINENKMLKDKLEQLEHDIKERDINIQNLHKEIDSLKNGNHVRTLKKNMQEELNKSIRKNHSLSEFNKEYIKTLYNRYNYTPSSRNSNQALIDNFWSVARNLKKAKEKQGEEKNQ